MQCAFEPPASESRVMTSAAGTSRKLYWEWLSLDPKVLIVDEPTRGIDVGAKAEISGFSAHWLIKASP